MQLHRLPQPVRDTLERLEDAGHASLLVGRCLRELLAGDLPDDFEVLCRAEPGEVLALLPLAVVTSAGARRVTQPSPAGPIEIVMLAADASFEAALERRDFTIHAIGYRHRSGELVDPVGGRADLESRRLRNAGPAKERFAEDPVRALRAARLVSELQLELDPEVESAMHAATADLDAMRGRRLREEIEPLLLAEDAGEGLALLRRTGLERSVAPEVGDDAAAVVAQLPRDLDLRLAAWLRGTRARAILRDLRCPRDRAVRVERILQMHPVDGGPAAARESRARRLARRPERERQGLIALREAEVRARGEATPRSLEHLVRSLERALRAERSSARRSQLALDGRAVMEHLGCGPGATVGRALRFLTEQVEAAPERNEESALRALLDEWAQTS